MTKCWLIPFLIAGLFGDKAFADCLPAPDTPASVIEYFQRFNKPLPEQFCAKEAAPQASEEPLQQPQAEEAPDQYGDDGGPGDGPRHYYQGGSPPVPPRWTRSGSAVCPENFDYYDSDGLCRSRDYQGGSANVAPRWTRSGSAVCPENFDYYDSDGLCRSRD
jgi:hypothetical protein